MNDLYFELRIYSAGPGKFKRFSRYIDGGWGFFAQAFGYGFSLVRWRSKR